MKSIVHSFTFVYNI